MEKIKTTVGVFAGILNTGGELLLVRRTVHPNILDEKGEKISFKGNWELPGGGVMDAEKVSYCHLVNELKREVQEEVGVVVSPDLMPAMYPVLFKGSLGYDLALVTPIETSVTPTKEKTILVSPEELERLAKEYEPADKKTGKDGKGIVSGYGKRMHCMALKALCFSPNPEYAKQAWEMLTEIQKVW